MTRFLCVTQVFHPSSDALSQLLYDLTRYLAERGMDVHVLTSAVNYMTGELLPLRDTVHGVCVWRTPALPLSKFSTFGKVAAYGSFWLGSWPGLAYVPTPDVVMYQSTPPMLGLSAPAVRRWHGARTCLVMQDVYPELPVRMGTLSNNAAIKLLSALDRRILAGFDHIVVLGERMLEAIAHKGIRRDRLSIIENWSVAENTEPMRRNTNPLLRKLGLLRRFVVQYSGNMGMAHDMGTIVEAARLLRDDGGIAFLLIGDGERRGEVDSARARWHLENVTMLPFQPRDRLPISLTAADVALVSLRPELEGLALPSKFYGILGAGVPAIFIGDADGEFARIIHRWECGVVVQTSAQLAAAIRALRDDPLRTRRLAANARRAFVQRFGRERSLPLYAELVARLASTATSARARR